MHPPSLHPGEAGLQLNGCKRQSTRALPPITRDKADFISRPASFFRAFAFPLPLPPTAVVCEGSHHLGGRPPASGVGAGVGSLLNEKGGRKLFSALRRAPAVVTMLALVVLPLASSVADPKDDLDSTMERLGDIRRSIRSGEASSDSLDAQIDLIGAGIVELRTLVQGLTAEAAVITSEVRGAEARIEATERQLGALRGRARAQAVHLYKTGSANVLDALLGAGSVAELGRKADLLGIAAERNISALVSYGRLGLRIEAQHEELFARKAELETTLAERSNALSELKRAYESHAVRLAALEGRLGEQHRAEGDLRARSNRLRAKIRSAQERLALRVGSAHWSGPVQSLKVSAQGFRWPLNDVINSYFGDRWGTRHTGLDIDGDYGTPVEAARSGRVIMAAYYGGYGNAVIIDHGGGLSTLYGHLSSTSVRLGDDIAKGRRLGRVGCTGHCTGNHLHFEVRVHGNPKDPLDYLP